VQGVVGGAGEAVDGEEKLLKAEHGGGGNQSPRFNESKPHFSSSAPPQEFTGSKCLQFKRIVEDLAHSLKLE
jgi:hypothetical protein